MPDTTLGNIWKVWLGPIAVAVCLSLGGWYIFVDRAITKFEERIEHQAREIARVDKKVETYRDETSKDIASIDARAKDQVARERGTVEKLIRLETKVDILLSREKQ